VCNFARTLRDVCFADCLQGIYPLGVLLANLHDLTKTTLSNDFEQIEGFNCERLVADGFEVNFEMERPRSSYGIIPLI